MLKLVKLGTWLYGDYNHFKLNLYRGSDNKYYIDNVMDNDNIIIGIDDENIPRDVSELPAHIQPLYE